MFLSGGMTRMYIRLAQKANALLHYYKIKNFPVSIPLIEEIIHDEKVKIVIRKNLNHACVIGDHLLLKECVGSDARYQLSHEYLHIKEHPGNRFMSSEFLIAKNEAQAKAFAAYFLMPLGLFERSLKEDESEYELAEEYGVSQELVRYRKFLTKSLIESGYYDALAGHIWFR